MTDVVPPHAVLQSLPVDVAVVFDADLRYLAVGGAGLTAVGLSQESMEGRTVEQALPARTASALEPLYRQALAGLQSVVDVPYEGRVFEQRLAPVRDDTGTVVAGVGCAFDVTALRAAERATHESDQRFRLGFEHAPIGMAIVGLDGRFHEVNPALCKITGYGREALMDLTFQDITHPDDLDDDLGHLARLLTGEIDSYQLEKRYFTATGGLVWVLLAVTLVLADDGEPMYYIAQIKDITERRIQQDELREAHAFQAAVLAASPDVVEVLAPGSSRAQWSSRSWAELLGHPSDDGEPSGGGTFQRAVPADDRADLDDATAQASALADGQTVQVRHRIRHADGSVRWIARRVTPFRRDAHGAVTHLLAVSRDVTDAVLLEESLQHAAHHDELTGLPNRRLVRDRLADQLAADHRTTAVLFCDLDGFKQINDSLGHSMGDAVLLEMSRRLVSATRPRDTVGRMGGDEFVVLLRIGDGQDPAAVASAVAGRVCAALGRPLRAGGGQHVVTVSIGIALPREGANADDLLVDADAAMYLAKLDGKNGHALFPPGTSAASDSVLR